MKKITTALISLTLLTSINANAESEYICKTSKITGFKAVGNSWHSTNFTDTITILVKKTFPCNEGYSIKSTTGYWYGCSDQKFNEKYTITSSGGGLDKFTLSTTRLKFTATYMGGFINNIQTDTPILMIGRCEKV